MSSQFKFLMLMMFLMFVRRQICHITVCVIYCHKDAELKDSHSSDRLQFLLWFFCKTCKASTVANLGQISDCLSFKSLKNNISLAFFPSVNKKLKTRNVNQND